MCFKSDEGGRSILTIPHSKDVPPSLHEYGFGFQNRNSFNCGFHTEEQPTSYDQLVSQRAGATRDKHHTTHDRPDQMRETNACKGDSISGHTSLQGGSSNQRRNPQVIVDYFSLEMRYFVHSCPTFEIN